MIKAGVIGFPIEHSLSPKLHGYWLEGYEIAGSYEKILIAPDDLQSGIYRLRDDGYAGFNVTIPHKRAILPLMDTLDPVAKRIGAVNTVVIDSDGKFHGFNTDAYGFWQNLRQNVPDLNFPNIVVLGAGGAARAVIDALVENDAEEIYILNRTLSKAEKLAEDFQRDNIKIYPLEWGEYPEIFTNAGLLVNTTSLGMVGQLQLDLDVSTFFDFDKVVYDLVYNPLMTKLLINAEKNDCDIVTGLGMLINQAVPAFEKWFGKKPDFCSGFFDDEIIELLKNDK